MPPQSAIYDNEGKLTRAGMESIIKSGGSVMWKGTIISKIGELPPESDVVKGDTAREQAVLNRLDAEIAEKHAERSRILARQQAAPTPPAPTAAETKQAAKDAATAAKDTEHDEEEPHKFGRKTK